MIASFTCKVVRICLQVSEQQIQIGFLHSENHEANWGWNLAKLLTWFSTQELMMVAVDQNSTINNKIVKTCENYLIAGTVQKKKTVGQKLQTSPYTFHHPSSHPFIPSIPHLVHNDTAPETVARDRWVSHWNPSGRNKAPAPLNGSARTADLGTSLGDFALEVQRPFEIWMFTKDYLLSRES